MAQPRNLLRETPEAQPASQPRNLLRETPQAQSVSPQEQLARITLEEDPTSIGVAPGQTALQTQEMHRQTRQDRAEAERQRRAQIRNETLRGFDPANIVTSIGRDIVTGATSREPQAPSSRATQLLGQGASLGFGDEIGAGAAALQQGARNIAGVGGGQTTGDAFAQSAEASRQQLAETRQAAPVTSFAGEALGGGVVGVPGASRFIGGATTRAGATARATGVGAVTGGVVGAGETEGGLARRAVGALTGAAAGTALGIVAPLAIEGAARTATGLGRVASRAFNRQRGGQQMTSAQRRAWRRLTGIAEQAGITEGQLAERFARSQELGTEDLFVFELLGNEGIVQARGGVASNNPAAIAGLERVRARQATTQARVQEDLRLALGSDGSEYVASSQVLDDLKGASGPLYEALEAMPGIRSEALADRGFSSAPAWQIALREALDQARNDLDAEDVAALSAAIQDEGADLARLVEGAEIPPRVLDRVKRRLGAQEAIAIRQGDGDLARQIGDLRRSYVAFLDGRYPGVYSAARRAYAGPAAQQDALELGESVIRGVEGRRFPENLADQVRDMSADELASFRVGVASGVVNQMRAAPNINVQTAGGVVTRGGEPANIVGRFWNRTDQQEVLRAAFGNEQAFTRFAQRMARETEGAESLRLINVQRTGSPTQANQQAADLATGVADAAQGNLLSASIQAIRRFATRPGAFDDPRVIEELQRILFSSPADVRPQLEAAIREARAQATGGQASARFAREASAPAISSIIAGGQ